MPVVLALRQWGEEWGGRPADIMLVNRSTGSPVRKICVQSEDGKVLNRHDDLVWVSRAHAESVNKGWAA